MRFRLLRRRLTISAPRMSVRSAMPWPLRWVILALSLGFCAAISLWAFEFRQDIAGLDHGAKSELQHLRSELASVRAELEKAREERDQAQSIANTAGTLVTAEKASQEKVLQQLKQLEADNRSLRDDLGFFEKLIPTGSAGGVSIRGVQGEMQPDNALRWQVLVIQPSRNASEFAGRLEIMFSGTQSGKSWSAPLAGGPQNIKIKQYGRLEGTFQIPAQVVVKSITARLLEGSTVRATQTIKL